MPEPEEEQGTAAAEQQKLKESEQLTIDGAQIVFLCKPTAPESNAPSYPKLSNSPASQPSCQSNASGAATPLADSEAALFPSSASSTLAGSPLHGPVAATPPLDEGSSQPLSDLSSSGVIGYSKRSGPWPLGSATPPPPGSTADLELGPSDLQSPSNSSPKERKRFEIEIEDPNQDDSEVEDESIAEMKTRPKLPRSNSSMLLSRRCNEAEGWEDLQDRMVYSFTQDSSSTLQKKWKRRRRHLWSTNLVAALGARRPIAALLAARPFQVLLLLLIPLYFYRGLLPILNHLRPVEQRTSHFKFFKMEILEQRRGGLALALSNVTLGSFGILLDGCPVKGGSHSFEPFDHAVHLEFEDKMAMNGYFFNTASGNSDADPVRWKVYGSNNKESWTAVGASKFRFEDSAFVKLLEGNYDTPVARNHRVDVDHRPMQYLHVWLGWCFSVLFLGFAFVVVLLVAMFVPSEQHLAQDLLSWSWLLVAGLWIVSGLVHHNGIVEGVASLLWGLWAASFSFALAYAEGALVLQLLLHGMGLIVGEFLIDVMIYQDPTSLYVSPPWTGIFCCALGTGLWLYRRRVISRTLSEIAADRDEWMGLWEDVKQDELQELKALQAVAQEVAGSISHPAEQFNRIRRVNQIASPAFVPSQDFSRAASTESVASVISRLRSFTGRESTASKLRYSCQFPDTLTGTIDFQNPVKSLDQLYVQGCIVHPLLMYKTGIWKSNCVKVCALPRSNSNKVLPRGQSFNHFETLITKLKRPQRVYDKVTRCYGNRISHILDICRQTIVCNNVEEITKCLRCINQDRDIVIVRIKNGMDFESEAEHSAGFRLVVVNLKVVNEETMRLGVESHVCEVTLMLESFASRMSPEKHERYIRFRDLHRPVVYSNACVNRFKNGQPHSSTGSEPVSVKIDPEEQDAPSLKSSTDTRTSNSESQTILHSLITIRSTTEGGYLDYKVKKGYSLKTASAGSVLFTAQPVVAAMVYRVFQFVLVAFSVLSLLRGYDNHVVFQKNNEWEFSALKMVVLESRANVEPPAAGSIADFGILHKGCIQQHAMRSYKRTNSTVTVQFERVHQMNGFYYQIGSLPQESDPVRFEVYATKDGEEWQHVGSSRWRINDDGTPRLLGGYDRTTRTRGETVKVDLRIPWMWAANFSWNFLPYSVGMLVLAVRGFLHKFEGASIIMSAGLLINLPMGIANLVGWHMAGWWQELIFFGLYGTGSIGLGLCILHQKYLFWGIVIMGLYAVFIDMLRNVLLWRDPAGFLINPPTSGFMIAGIGMLCVSLRSFILIRSRQLVLGDKAKYDKLWEDLTRRLPLEAFTQLNDAASRLVCSEQKCRQIVRGNVDSCVSSIWHDLHDNTESQIPNLQTPRALLAVDLNATSTEPGPELYVRSLDQLYAQAQGLLPLLREKVQGYAAHSNGMFEKRKIGHVSHQGPRTTEFIRWTDALKEPELQAQIKWPGVKKIERSIEKITRVYGDISRLVDVTRETIIFESIADIITCLRIIHSDPDVRVIRVKNRMKIGDDAVLSAGYRNISINLVVCTPQSQKLGLDGHVAELQLLLQDFAQIKNDQGHRRYREFRNARAE